MPAVYLEQTSGSRPIPNVRNSATSYRELVTSSVASHFPFRLREEDKALHRLSQDYEISFVITVLPYLMALLTADPAKQPRSTAGLGRAANGQPDLEQLPAPNSKWYSKVI